MICTFGDTTDVTWWRELQLDTRALIGRDGRFSRETPEWITSAEGRERYERMAGTTVFTAQKTVVEMLVEAGEMDGDPKPITHPVKFYEKGDKPSKSLLPASGTSATVAVTLHAARSSSSAAVR